MKKILGLCLFIILAQNVFGAGSERVLTESSVIQTAMSINPDILIQVQKIELAQQRIKESTALYLPTVDLNFNLSKFDNGAPSAMQTNLSPVPIYLPEGIKDSYYNTRLSVWQSVYTGGRIRAANKLARMNMAKAKNEENLAKIRVITKAKILFNNCLYYKEKIKLLTVLHSRTNDSDTMMKLDNSKLGYEKEVLNLLNLIGLELNTIVEVSGELKPIIKNLDLNQCLVLAYQYKPEIQLTQYQESIDGLMVNLISMQRYPTVTIGASQEWAGDEIINDKNNWYIAINANFPIFDGGAAFSRVAQGKITIREAALERSKAEDKIRLEVSKIFLEYSFWKKKALDLKLVEKNGQYNDYDLDVISSLNKSYYELELAIGVQLDQY